MLQPKVILLTELRRHLEYGDNREIAKRTGFTEVYVSMCLSSTNSAYNQIIVDEAMAVVSERNNRITRQLDSVKTSTRR